MSNFSLLQNLSTVGNVGVPEAPQIDTLISDDGTPIIKLSGDSLVSRGDTIIDIVATPRAQPTQTIDNNIGANLVETDLNNISFLRTSNAIEQARVRLDVDRVREDTILERHIIGNNSFRGDLLNIRSFNNLDGRDIKLKINNGGVEFLNKSILAIENTSKHYDDIVISSIGGSTIHATRSVFSITNPNKFKVRVAIHRKLIGSLRNSDWVKIATIGVPPKVGFMFIDEGASVSATEYAVVMPNKKMFKIKTPSIGRNFNSKLIDNIGNINKKPLQPLVLQSSTKTSILIYDLPNECVSVSLYTNNQLISEANVINNKVAFSDANAIIQSRKYVYDLHLHYRNGSTVKKKISVLRNNNLFGNDVKCKVNKINGDLSNSSIRLGVNCEITKQGVETLIDALRQVSPEIVESYSGDITELRDNVRNLLFYEVQRYDTYTGNSYTLGVFPSTQREIILSSNNQDNIPPFPVRGHMIVKVTPIIRSPTTLFESSDTIARVDDLESFNLRFRRFFHPISLSYDVIPTSSRILQSPGASPEYLLATSDELLLGRVASDSILEYSAPVTNEVKLSNIKFSQKNRRSGNINNDILVEWTMNNPPKNGYRINIHGVDRSGIKKIEKRFYWSDKKTDKILITRPNLKVSNITIDIIND